MTPSSIIFPLYQHMQKFSSASDVQTNGARLIGHAPHVGKQAFLHGLYSPLSESDVLDLEAHLGMKIPEHLLGFYSACNGFNYFSDTLSLDGLRRTAGRGLDAVHQPYDLLTPNVDERLEDASPDMFFIGGYDWDGSRLYTHYGDPCIYFCSPESAEPLMQWPSMAEFIAAESQRIAGLFNDQGIEIDASVSTLPI